MDWTDHLVPVAHMIDYVKGVKAAVHQPATFCENHVPWQHKLRDLVDEVDFISLHTYPVWEYKTSNDALAYTEDNSRAAGILCFVFEAFDEPWKGSPDPLEPEKHRGLFTVDRKPKLAMQALYAELAKQAASVTSESIP